MNKLLISFIGALTVGAALPAMAGPDWATIERGRNLKPAARGDSYSALPPTAAGPRECPPRLVLPLDHGPRAVTTSQENELRAESHAARMKTCQERAK
jgi:hypothetical protein